MFVLDDPPHDFHRLTTYATADSTGTGAVLAELVEAEPDLTVVGEWDRAKGALKAVGDLSPHVAVLDVRLGDGSGVEVCRDIRSELPSVACLMFTSFADDHARSTRAWPAPLAMC
jgi:DNA-binding NarL/FixJ family response regulator